MYAWARTASSRISPSWAHCHETLFVVQQVRAPRCREPAHAVMRAGDNLRRGTGEVSGRMRVGHGHAAPKPRVFPLEYKAMNWKIKALTMAILSRVPAGKSAYLALQAALGTNRL